MKGSETKFSVQSAEAICQRLQSSELGRDDLQKCLQEAFAHIAALHKNWEQLGSIARLLSEELRLGRSDKNAT